MYRVAACLFAFSALMLAQSTPADPIEIRTGVYQGHVIRYRVVNGLAIYQGDIILGRADQIDETLALPSRRPVRISPREGAGTAFVSQRWPMVNGVAQVPYVITNGSANVTAAISKFNSLFSGIITWAKRTSQVNYVNIDLSSTDTSGVCEATEGMAGIGAQMMGGSISCAEATILHEMGHVVGLWHEQSRTDRDSFVTVDYANIDKPFESNFDKQVDDEQDIGQYDYASIMHYNWGGFSKNGLPTIESIPAGIPLSNTVSYTNSDIDAIKRLYGAPPTSVIIDSNPTGAKVIVDSTTYTAPHTFAWSLNSTHTLDTPAGAQTIAGNLYTFARWGDGSTGVHTITVTPGNGFQSLPASSPAVTAYTANFALQRAFSLTVSPSGGGTVQLSPQPATISGTQYYVDRQVVTMTPTPSSGYNFYNWSGSGPTDLFEGNAENPKHLLMYYPASVITNFTTGAVTALETDLPLSFPPPYLTADGSNYTVPNDFSQAFDSTWTPASSHSVTAPSPQSPVTTNISYIYGSWSDGLGQMHNISAASSGTVTYTANYTGTYRAIATSNSYCAGTTSPTDTFITGGVSQNFTATPASGYAFFGWTGDIASSANPLSVNQSDELLLAANFNVATASAALAITSLNPSSVTANTGPQTLTINGTGFTSSSTTTYLYLNGAYTTYTYVSPTQLSVQLTNAVIGSPGGVSVIVGNYTSSCGLDVEATLKVVEPSAPDLKITKTHTGNFTRGETGATYTITVHNNGTGSTSGTVSVIDVLPSGLTATAIAGTGWTCTLKTLTCTRTDVLAASASYPVITLTVTVNGNAPSTVTNKAVVSGGDEIVTNNDTATNATTITGTPPPQVVSVSPSTGSGVTKTFTLAYTDAGGEAMLAQTYVLFNTTSSTASACAVYYDQSTGLLNLYTDAGTSTVTLTAGSGAVSNSQCTLNGTGSSITASGNNLTLKLSFTFAATFTGSKTVYMEAVDTSSTTTGWLAKGTWTTGVIGPPTIVSASPNSGSGASQTFTLTYSDPNGAADLSKVNVLFNTTTAAANACEVYYSGANGLFYLDNDAGTGTTTVTPGSGSASNSQCTLTGAGSSVSPSGNTLTMTLVIGFSGTFTGSKTIYMNATEFGGKTTGWKNEGSWTP